MGCGGRLGPLFFFTYLVLGWAPMPRACVAPLHINGPARGAFWVASIPVDIHRNYYHNSLRMKEQVLFAKQGFHSYQVVQDFVHQRYLSPSSIALSVLATAHERKWNDMEMNSKGRKWNEWKWRGEKNHFSFNTAHLNFVQFLKEKCRSPLSLLFPYESLYWDPVGCPKFSQIFKKLPRLYQMHLPCIPHGVFGALLTGRDGRALLEPSYGGFNH